MRMHPTPFPETRQNNAKHQAELLVYQTLSRSAAPGLALYGFHPDRNAPESDFLLWLEGVAHFNIEVKGSEYTLENGMWRLHSCHGSEKVSSPLTQAWDSAVSVRSAVRSKLGRRIFVYSVLLFTDMDGDPAIQEAADSNNRTHLLWRVDHIVERLCEIARVAGNVFSPPTEAQIQEEARLWVPGLDLAANPPQEQAAAGIPARNVTIHHVETLNMYVSGDGTPTIRQDSPIGE